MLPLPRYSGFITNRPFWAIQRLESMLNLQTEDTCQEFPNTKLFGMKAIWEQQFETLRDVGLT